MLKIVQDLVDHRETFIVFVLFTAVVASVAAYACFTLRDAVRDVARAIREARPAGKEGCEAVRNS